MSIVFFISTVGCKKKEFQIKATSITQPFNKNGKMKTFYDADLNCSDTYRTLSVNFNETKTVRVYIGNTPSLFKFSFYITGTGTGNNYIQYKLLGTTDRVLHTGSGIGFSGVSNCSLCSSATAFYTWITGQESEYIYLYVNNKSNENDSIGRVLTFNYKIECPVASGSQVMLHWSPDTPEHAMDSNFSYFLFDGDNNVNGYTGYLPYWVEDSSLEIGKRIFILPTILLGKTNIGNLNYMTNDERFYNFYAEYHNASSSITGLGAQFFNMTTHYSQLVPSAGYFSDGTNWYKTNNDVVIIEKGLYIDRGYDVIFRDLSTTIDDLYVSFFDAPYGNYLASVNNVDVNYYIKNVSFDIDSIGDPVNFVTTRTHYTKTCNGTSDTKYFSQAPFSVVTGYYLERNVVVYDFYNYIQTNNFYLDTGNYIDLSSPPYNSNNQDIP